MELTIDDIKTLIAVDECQTLMLKVTNTTDTPISIL